MEIIDINKIAIETVLNILKAGGVVVSPTDTVYGLLADATNEAAIQKLIKIKERPPGKPISVFVSDFRMMKEYIYIDNKQENTLKQFIPGPFTVVLRSLHAVSTHLESENGTLGVRIPDYPFIRDLVQAFGKPLTATSANPSGYPPFYSTDAILHGFPKSKLQCIDLLIDSGNLPHNKPSTVVDLTESTIKTLRKGDIVFSDIKTFVSDSPDQTQKIAQYLLTKKLFEQTDKPIVFILKGELGAGKTVFVKGIGQTLGIYNIISPTYVVYYEYDSLHNEIKKLYHFDLFRVRETVELKELKIQNLLKPGCLFCFEWGEKAAGIIPMLKEKATIIYVEISYLNENKRELRIQY